ncbi:dsRBD fold-containing protein [Streptomyces sp. HSW2009]|uniref:dsRBD fold-containing protein n=1 Tax=Streptomyces sp. HSW2009 TaxID=3142890 RepID=UPI0032EB8E07
MTGTKKWNAEITITEVGREVTAEARLRGENSGSLVGHGTAIRKATDAHVPAIGDELAAARAFSDLSHQLVHHAAEDIEAHTRQPVDHLRV